MSTGQVVLVVAVLLALAFGAYRAAVDGRFRGTHRVRGAAAPVAERSGPVVTSVLADTPWAGSLGDRATFVQFSSGFCAPCRATRRILEDVTAQAPGVAHVEIDAEHHLDLVRRLGVSRTPTTLVLDARGAELARAAGTPTKALVLQVLESIGD